MFSYSCLNCSQRLLAPTEKAGTKTICPKCLKPLTVPAHDRMAAIDLEEVIEPTYSEIQLPSMSSASGLMAQDTGSAPQDYEAAPGAYATTVQDEPQAAYEIDLDGDQNTANAIAGSLTTTPPSICVKSPTPPPITTAAAFQRKHAPSDMRGMVNLTPTGIFSVDVGAQLSATLSMRMAPPLESPSERRITIGAWVLVTVTAMLVWIAGVFFRPEWFACVALLGAALVAFGYAWRAYLTGQSSGILRGLCTLLPPVNAVVQLKSSEEHGHRPLRFVLAGVAVLALFVLGQDTHTVAAAAFKHDAPAQITEPAPSLAATIRDLSEQKKDGQLLRYIRELPYLPAFRSAGVEEKAELAGQLVNLTQSPRTELREVSFVTLLSCSPDDARKVLLAILRDNRNREVGFALGFADRVASPEIAEAVVERLGDPAWGEMAANAAEKLGTLAEPALITKLGNEKATTASAACDLLGKVGTAKSLQPLQRLAENSGDAILKDAAKRAIRDLKVRHPEIALEKVSDARPAVSEVEKKEIEVARSFTPGDRKYRKP